MSDDKPAKERRREPRIHTRIQVDYKAASTFLFAYITDISSLGIFLQTEKGSPPGTRLTLRFSPPAQVRDAVSDDPFEVDGIVRWVSDSGGHEPGMGIEFVDLEEGTRKRLLEMINAIAYLDRD